MFYLKPDMKHFHLDCKEFAMEVFDAKTRPVLSNIAKILGKNDDNIVEKPVLGRFSMMMKLGMVLDIPSYW